MAGPDRGQVGRSPARRMIYRPPSPQRYHSTSISSSSSRRRCRWRASDQPAVKQVSISDAEVRIATSAPILMTRSRCQRGCTFNLDANWRIFCWSAVCCHPTRGTTLQSKRPKADFGFLSKAIILGNAEFDCSIFQCGAISTA